MARPTLWKLRRLAPRAKRVIERRQGDAPVMAAYANTMIPAADRFMATYDRAARMRGRWKLANQERHQAVGTLAGAMQCWLPPVSRDVLSFDRRALRQTSVPDDVMHDAEYLVNLVIENTADTGALLTYQEPLLLDMNDKLVATRARHAEAETLDREYQQCLADVRREAQAFQGELIVFRRTLAALLGRNDKDYQKLRFERASHQDEDDDPTAPAPPGDGEDLPGDIG